MSRSRYPILAIEGNRFLLFELEKQNGGPKLITKRCKSYSGDPRLKTVGDEKIVSDLVKEFIKIKRGGKIGSCLSERKRMAYNYDKNITYKERKKVSTVRSKLDIPVKVFPNDENDLPVKDLDDLIKFFQSYMGSKLTTSNLNVRSPRQISKQALLGDYLSACYKQLYGNYRKSLGGLASQRNSAKYHEEKIKISKKTVSLSTNNLNNKYLPSVSASVTPRNKLMP